MRDRSVFGVLCAVLLTIALVVLLTRCGPVVPPPVDPDPPPAPTVEPPNDAGPDDCQRGYERLRELQCMTDDGYPTWEGPGGTWADRCREEARHGIDYHPACVSAIESCEERNAAAKGELCPAGGEP